jgi:two-component sensor histidine kinase/PAS domain-containing protein
MTEVSPSSPCMYPKGRAVTLEDILITSELTHRRPRAPDYASENRALAALACEMAVNLRNLPQTIVDTAMDLCRAGTAGISVLKADTDGEYFSLEALSGVYAPYIRQRTARQLSFCGSTLDRNAPQLFLYPARCFTDFARAEAPIVEALVIPVYVSGWPRGALWILAHDETRRFDGEDVRLLTSLAAFASAALQVVSVLEAQRPADQTRRVYHEAGAAALQGPLAAVGGAQSPVDAARHIGEWQFRRLLEKLPAGAYTCDPDGLITYCNPQAIQLWGRAPQLNHPVDRFCGSFKLFTTDGIPIAHDQCWMALALKRNQAYNGREIVIERPDGRRLTALAYANPIQDEARRLLGAVNVLVDITERKQAEERLQASLHEKEVLLKEVHHRVKNNLQIIVSLLSLQSDQLKDPEDVALFEDTQNRVRSMALIHESLYRTGDLAHFNFARYIERLSMDLLKSQAPAVSHINLRTQLDEIAFDVDTAIPCGLILNELLTNALKYAFPDGRSGDIHIRLKAEGEHVTLRVRDTGMGFPEGFDFLKTESLGLQLVNMLAEQLGGTLTLTHEGGTTVTVSIPAGSRQMKEGAYAHGPDSDSRR